MITVNLASPESAQEMFWLADALFQRHLRAHKRALRNGDTKAAAEAADGLLAAASNMRSLHAALHTPETAH